MSIGFENLRVYQEALDFSDRVYKATKKFPKAETFLLTNQLRRAAISIVLNIAEGSGRTKKEFKHFLNMGQGICIRMRGCSGDSKKTRIYQRPD